MLNTRFIFQKLSFAKSSIAVVLFLLHLLSSSVWAADYPPNIDYGTRGDFIIKLGDRFGRTSNLTTVGPILFNFPEQAGSSSLAIDELSLEDTAWDLSDLTNPVIIGSLTCIGCPLGEPINAHGTVVRYPQNTASSGLVWQNPGYWAFDGTQTNSLDQLVNTQIDWGENSAPTYSNMYVPFYMRMYWDYDFNPEGLFAIRDPSVFNIDPADFEFLGEQENVPTLGLPLASWDHLGMTGVTGFSLWLGELLIVASDQQQTGLAIYDVAGFKEGIEPELLSVFQPMLTEPDGDYVGLGGYWVEPYGANKLVWAARRKTTVPTRDFPALYVVDISNPSFPKLTCEIYFDQNDLDASDGDASSNPMYVGFQDEFIFVDHFKVNLDECERDYLDGQISDDDFQSIVYRFDDSANQCDSSQYFRPLGQVGVFGGFDWWRTPDVNEQGMCFFVTDDAPDTRAPFVSGHRPLDAQANYPLYGYIHIHIPETLRTETLAQAITLFNETAGSNVSFRHQVSHTGTISLWPDQELAADSLFRVTLSGVQDFMGNTMADYSFRFTTGAVFQQRGTFHGGLIDTLNYTSAQFSGVTEAGGEYDFSSGQTVTFSIGNMALPPIIGAVTTTLLDFSEIGDINDQRVINVARLLQTIDADNNPGNGIDLSDTARAAAIPLNFDQSVTSFEADADVRTFIANSGSVLTELVPTRQAMVQLAQELVTLGVIDNEDSDNDGVPNIVDFLPHSPSENFDSDRDGIGDNTDFDDDNDGVNDSADPAPLNPLIPTPPTPIVTAEPTPSPTPFPDGSTPTPTPQVPSFTGEAFYPNQSSQLTCPEPQEREGRVWAVNPDNDTVTIFSRRITDPVAMSVALDIEREITSPPYEAPTSVTEADEVFVVTYRDDDKIVFFDADGDPIKALDTGYGTQPVASVYEAGFLYVSLYGSGEVLKIDVSAITSNPALVMTSAIVARLNVGPFPKALAIRNGRLLVTRYISAADHAEVYDIDTVGNMTFNRIITINKVLVPDDIEHGSGVPNFLSSIVINSEGNRAYVPAVKMNIDRGVLRNGIALDGDNTVRPMIAILDLINHRDANVDPTNREGTIDLDNGADPAGVTILPDPAIHAHTMSGNNIVVVQNPVTNKSAQYRVGHAPQDMCSTLRTLFVKNATDHSVSAVDIAAFLNDNNSRSQSVVTTRSVSEQLEVYTAEQQLGLQLFYHSKMPEMGDEGYITCASCHRDGGQDGMVWDMASFGEGFRNTISLNGMSGTRFGNLHWTAYFDEVQDFERQLEQLNEGDGLIPGVTFAPGVSPLEFSQYENAAELNALATYVNSLGKATLRRSPHKNFNGQLSVEAEAGRLLFEAEGNEELGVRGCTSCHQFDSGYRGGAGNEAHDVGTVTPTSNSGTRLGEAFTEIRTPTLVGLWDSAPYFHNGSAATLLDVFSVGLHQQEVVNRELTPEQLNQLVEYLLTIDREDFIDD